MPTRAAPKTSHPSVPPECALDAARLLSLLRRHGGREYAGVLCFGAQEQGEYRLTARGERVRAQGPSGTVSELDQAAFMALFGRSLFVRVHPSGVLTDLGPLFSQG